MGEDRRALLQRFRPEVVHDSREAFPAASVSEMLDDPWVTLCRADGTPIAVAGSGESDLNSGFFTAAGYRNGEPHAAGDHISFPEAHHDYRAQARQIEREHPEMADVVYGHLAQDGTAEKRFWVQYWFFMRWREASSYVALWTPTSTTTSASSGSTGPESTPRRSTAGWPASRWPTARC